MVKSLVWVLMALLIVGHYDFWLWNDARRFLGLPIGLSYHVLSCLVASLVLSQVVRYAWPRPAVFAESSEAARAERDAD